MALVIDHSDGNADLVSDSSQSRCLNIWINEWFRISEKGPTLKRWWARRTRPSSDLIFFFVSFACHIWLIHPVVFLTRPVSFFNTRLLQATQTPDSWLESKRLSVYWAEECNENNWLDYDLQGLVKFRYAITVMTLSQTLEVSDGVDEIGCDIV